MPGWQKKFEELGNDEFTIVGLALDAEGVKPAKTYYDKFGVKFPSLVDPNYATKFGAVPKTFFINEHGVVLNAKGWEEQLKKMPPVKPVSDDIRKQWSGPNNRFDEKAIQKLVKSNESNPTDLSIAAELGSRYISLGKHAEAETVLNAATGAYDAKQLAQIASSDKAKSRLLANAYLQRSRASVDDREKQVDFATTSFFLNPTIGFGKQISRIIAPEKFDGRPDGSFDNRFREGTLRRLKEERKEWLKASSAVSPLSQ